MPLAPMCIYIQSSVVASQSKVFSATFDFHYWHTFAADILPRKAWILTVYYNVLSPLYNMYKPLFLCPGVDITEVSSPYMGEEVAVTAHHRPPLDDL